MITHLKKMMLRRLIRANIWGAKHTPLRFVMKGVPQRYKQTEKRTIKTALKELMNDEWVLNSLKKTGKKSEEHISLNPRKVQEIKEFLNS